MANELKFGNKVVFLNGLPITLPTATSDPGSASAGDTYYNSTSHAIRFYNGSAWSSVSSGGTVTSVALADTSTTPIFGVTGSPITGAGTLDLTLVSQLQNTVLAGPTSGSGQPAFRALVAADIPSLATSYLSTSIMTTAGDILFENATPTAARLPIGSTGNVLTVVGGLPAWVAPATNGTVTSVSLTAPSSILTVSGSPVTSSGTLALSLAVQAANSVFAGPASGGSVAPTFRSLVLADIPSLSSLYLSLSGGTMTGAINLGGFAPTNSTTPVNPNDLVNKSYVDNFINATSWKTAVLVATTANITLSGEQTIDGVLTSGSRVLVKNQSTASQNGIYVSASGAWTRSSDMNLWSEIPAAAVFVESGTVNADLGYVCTSQPGGTLGTTAINFVQFSSAGAYSADGTTLQLVGGVFSIKNAGVGIAQLGTITDGVTLDQSGAGGSLEVKTGGISNAQINAAAAIAYSKLNLTGDIVNSDISASAAIAYSKLNLTGSVVNADIAAAAAIAYTKLAALTANVVPSTSASGFLQSSSSGAVSLLSSALNRGLTTSNIVTETYVDSSTLTDNSSSPVAVPAFQFAIANFAGEEISYVIESANTNVDTRVGTIRVTCSNGGTPVVSLSDMFTESADCGVTWSASVTSGTVSISYTTTNQGANRTMRSDIKSFRR
jgi:hypothetical protein